MPSMHVAGAMLFALLGWRTHRLLGIVLSINVTLILIATVHLAWHYALDGYIAVHRAPGHMVGDRRRHRSRRNHSRDA